MDTVIGAIVVGIIGVAVLVGVLVLMARPMIGPLFSARARWHLRMRQRDLALADSRIAAGASAEARQPLGHAPYIAEYCGDDTFPDLVSAHNAAVLDRFVTFAEQQSVRSGNIARIEERLLRHAELLSALTEIRSSCRKLRSRRSSKGRETPGWALSEFARRRAELRRELAENSATLRKEIDAFLSGSGTEAGPAITYH